MLLALALGAAWAPAAQAQQSCTIEVDPLDFERYDPFHAQPNRVRGQIRVRCDVGLPVQHVALSTGQSGNYHRRYLASGGALARLQHLCGPHLPSHRRRRKLRHHRAGQPRQDARPAAHRAVRLLWRDPGGTVPAGRRLF
ncbi:spore coat protein U domain-containing protein [Phenylobacterium sp. J367]|nr:spore coat protein U domain-containing protein [Phenylobacterium sp. J367]MCR5877511.1 spore coat protein U domain-containing protein [Phenylobacterium sp. J367]